MWPTSDETQNLLDEARQGNARAAGQLLDRHREALRRMIQLRLDRRIQQRVDASDIVQEVMLEANRRLQTYLADPVMPFYLWLRQMARDRIIDAHRRHRASGKRSVDREQTLAQSAPLDHSTLNLIGQLADSQITPAEAATRQELQRRFDAAIDQLDDADREVVMMRHFEQLTNQDVSLALNISEPAASMRYLRAIRRLRKFFAEPSSSEDQR